MTATGEALIRIRTVGAEQVRAALTGIAQTSRTIAMRDAENATMATRVEGRTLRERVAANQQRFRQVVALDAAAAAEHEKNARRMVREAERTERERTRIAEREARERGRIRDRETRRAIDGDGAGGAGGSRGGGNVGGLGGGGALSLTGLLGGLYQGITAAISRGMATAGVRDRAEILAGAFDFRTAVESVGLSSGRGFEGTRAAVMAAATAGNLQPGDVATGLATGADLFGGDAAGDFVDNAERIAEAARATGSSFADLIQVLGALRSNFNVASEDMPELLGGLVELTRNGNIPLSALSRSFQDTFASMSSVRGGRRGAGGALEAVALVEALGGRYDAATTATMTSGLFQALGQRDVERRLRARGVRLREGGPDSPLRSLADIMAELGTNRRVGREAEAIGFDGRTARRALAVLGERPDALRATLAGLDTGNGLAFATDRARYLRETPEGSLAAIGIGREVATLNDAERIIGAYRETVGEVTELGNRFPLLAESMDLLRSAIIGLGIARVLSGGGGLAGLGGGLFGGGAAAAGGGGAAVGGAAIGGGALLGLGVGAVGLAAGAAVVEGMRADAARARDRATVSALARDALGRGDVDEAAAAFDLAPGGRGYGRLPSGRVTSGVPLGGAFAPGSTAVVRLDEGDRAALAEAIGR